MRRAYGSLRFAAAARTLAAELSEGSAASMLPAMKKNRKCWKCGCQNIIHLQSVADNNARAAGNPYTGRAIAFAGKHRLLSQTGAAFTEAFVCTGCGFFEEYVKDPQSVPWAELYTGA